MNEISLVILSVCLEAAIGIMLFLAIGKLLNKDINSKLATVIATIFAVVGVIASITHLGQPLKAFNSLLNLGGSWLSRETLGIMMFTACTVLCLIINLWKPAMKTVVRALEIAAAAIGIVLLFIMGSIYSFASVPVWEGANTYIEYYTSSIILGAILFFAATFNQQDRRSNIMLSTVIFAALAVQIIGSELHTAALGASGNAAGLSAEILRSNSVLITVKWVLLIGGVAVFCLRAMLQTVKDLQPFTAKGLESVKETAAAAETSAITGSNIVWASACAVLASAFIGKVLFFASMIVTNIGVQ